MRSCTEPSKTSSKVIVLGLMLACLLLLSACCKPCLQTPPPQAPDHLLVVRPVPAFTGSTNEDLLMWAVSIRDNAIGCNADKATLKTLLNGDDHEPAK